jgi:hypothetical protein
VSARKGIGQYQLQKEENDLKDEKPKTFFGSKFLVELHKTFKSCNLRVDVVGECLTVV